MKTKFLKNQLFIFALTLGLSVSLPTRSYGQEGDLFCHKSRLILGASKVKAKNANLVQTLGELSSEQYRLIDSLSGILVLDKNSNPAYDNTPVRFNSKTDVCGKVRRTGRAIRRTKMRKAQRRLSCVCDIAAKMNELLPNDPRFGEQLGLASPSGVSLQAPKAWEYFRGDKDVVVAVIDSGININHSDLASNIWVNPFEIPNNGIDDEGNGYIDDIYGWNFVDNNNDVSDVSGHGTHVAGIIGAKGNNSVGVSGVNWDISIMAMRFSEADGSGYYSYAARALAYMSDMYDRGVRVIASNNSYGNLGGYAAIDFILGAEIRKNLERDIFYVASAGNDNVNTDVNLYLPAALNYENVLAVGSIESSGLRSSFSNYGVNSVDIAAPGRNILSTSYTGGYVKYSGTSMAAPFVTGAIALLAGFEQDLSLSQIRGVILDHATKVQVLTGVFKEGNALNAYNMLEAVAGELPTPLPTVTPSPTATPVATVSSNLPPIIVQPTAVPTLPPLPKNQFRLQGNILIEDSAASSGEMPMDAMKIRGKVMIKDMKKGKVKSARITKDRIWSAILKGGRYEARLQLKDKSLRAKPAKIRLNLSSDATALNFSVRRIRK